MAEYIDRGELLKELERFPHLKTAGSVVRSMPKADVAPVVRCKDCKWWKPMDNGFSWNDEGRTDGECQMLYNIHDAERALTEREHFCGYGERKEQE